MRMLLVAALFWATSGICAYAGDGAELLVLRVSWGHQVDSQKSYVIRLVPTAVEFGDQRPCGLESADAGDDGLWRTTAGAGDVDGLEVVLRLGAMRSGRWKTCRRSGGS